jgi:hypothetical protein
MLPTHDPSRQCSGQAQSEKLPSGLFFITDSTDIFLLPLKGILKRITEIYINSYIITNESLGKKHC